MAYTQQLLVRHKTSTYRNVKMKIFIELHALLWNCEKLSITIVRLVFCTICDTVHPFTHPSFRCLQHQLTMDGGRKPLQAQREHANVIQNGQRRSQNTQQQLNLHIVTMSGFSPHNDPHRPTVQTRWHTLLESLLNEWNCCLNGLYLWPFTCSQTNMLFPFFFSLSVSLSSQIHSLLSWSLSALLLT